MKSYTIILLAILSFFLSCKEKEKQKNIFSLKYIKNNNVVILDFENNTSENIVFPVPNTLHFGDIRTKKLTSIPELDGFPPITVYAVIEPNQFSKNYQRKLDSIRNVDLSERHMLDLIKEMKPGDGNSVFYLKKNEALKIKYKLTIKPLTGRSYSSKYKQNYYPYDKVLKGNYPEGEYLRRFSKLNFGKAKFVAQPVIEDSLFLTLSEKDVTN